MTELCENTESAAGMHRDIGDGNILAFFGKQSGMDSGVVPQYKHIAVVQYRNLTPYKGRIP